MLFYGPGSVYPGLLTSSNEYSLLMPSTTVHFPSDLLRDVHRAFGRVKASFERAGTPTDDSDVAGTASASGERGAVFAENLDHFRRARFSIHIMGILT
jgi:hypothetical protein